MCVASQLFAVRAAQKNIKKARHERCPGAHKSAQRCSQKWRKAARHVPAAHESHKLEHHDQRPWLCFGEAKSIHHLSWLKPVKMLHSVLSYVLQHSVSTAKRDYRCFAKEQTFTEKRVIPTTPNTSEQNWQPP